MANTEFSLRDIDSNILQQHAAITRLPKIATSSTAIVNRAQVTNFAADGLPKMGVDRRTIQQVMEVFGEYGANGERVFKAVNDYDDAVRFVGSWTNLNDSNGQRPGTTTIGDYLEITFYGTGLNLLVYQDSSARQFTGLLNGSTSLGTFGASVSSVTVSRNTNANTIVPIVNGLTLGTHTVKLTLSVSALQVFGYEALNVSSSIFVPAATTYSGSRRLYSANTSTTAYNSGFESGTLGTRGGHVLVYQKVDGTIAKAVTPTNTTPDYLNSANHTNEEEVRRFHWREFGAGRTDDFSLLGGSALDLAFTLDDGTTTLAARACQVSSLNGGVFCPSNGVSFIAFTFVGTGLDIVYSPTGTGTNAAANATEFFVDGATVGNLTTVAATTNKVTQKIVSGLPYGTHMVRIVRNTASSWVPELHNLIVYAPKTPTLPANAVALADYFVMANYATDALSPITAFSVSTGVLRKNCTRELIYSGTFSMSAVDPTGLSSGFSVSTSVVNDYVEFTFFGTGFEFRPNGGSNGTTAWTMSLNGPANTNWTSYTTGVSAGTTITFTASTGVISIPSFPNRGLIYVNGLPLGRHTVRLTKTGGNGLISWTDIIEIITPIHAPKDVGPARLQNVATIGSSGVRDLRGLSPVQYPAQKAWSQAIGVSTTPTTTSVSIATPLADLSCTIKTSGGQIQISYFAPVTNNASNNETVPAIYLNGTYVPGTLYSITQTSTTTGQRLLASSLVVVPVSAGTHKVDVYWSVSAGTGTSPGSALRVLTVREL